MSAAVTFGQLDDFQDGSLQGWDEGFSSLNPPTNVSGGRRGAADRFLQNVSSGGLGAGSRQVMFNRSQWAGDYNAAHVSRITGWFANFGDTPLHLRLAVGGGGAQFGSTNAFDLPGDGIWRRATFDLTEASLSRLQGTASVSETLASVVELRLLSAANGPTFRGDPVAATLGVDELRAMRPEGDANFDGRVDSLDLNTVRSNLGSAAGGGTTWARGDFNFDGRVNAKDLGLLRRNFGLGAASPAAATFAVAGEAVVPEPSIPLVSCLATLALLRRRR